jgi:hypothetical protein
MLYYPGQAARLGACLNWSSADTRRGLRFRHSSPGAGDRAAWHFIEFFTVNIRNTNTRAAYGRAAAAFLRTDPFGALTATCLTTAWRTATP